MNKTKPTPFPDRRTRLTLALRAGVDERTLTRALTGQTRPHTLTERAIRTAAAELGIALPRQAVRQ